MTRVRWTEDYGLYKKGEEFDVQNPDTLKYMLENGKLEVVKQKAETATAPAAETATAKAETTTTKNTHHTAKKSKK